MNFLEIAETRQSCRSYDETRPVEDSKLNAILEAGRLAPSACNKQPLKFLFVRNPEMRAKIGKVYQPGWLMEAPVIAVVLGCDAHDPKDVAEPGMVRRAMDYATRFGLAPEPQMALKRPV